MNNLCIITARGGSKRIPYKNIVEVAGKPLIAWSIKAALDSKIFSKVLVSTDDEKIAEVARAHGAEVPFLRSAAFDGSSTASEAAIISLKQAEEYWETTFDNLVLLMPTCPLRTSAILKKQFDHFLDSEANFLLSCAEFGPFKPWWAAELNDKDQPEYINPEALKKRSQDLAKLVAPSGATWVAKRDSLVKEENFYGTGHAFYEIPWVAALDIDHQEDIDLINVLCGHASIQSLIGDFGH